CPPCEARAGGAASYDATYGCVVGFALKIPLKLSRYEDQYPQYTGHQSPRNARRRQRQVKRKDVVEFRGQYGQSKWHEVARKQQQSPKQLHREVECSKMRLPDGNKKLNRERIRQGRRWEEVKTYVKTKE